MGMVSAIGLVGWSVFMEVPHFHEGGETIHATGLHGEWGGKGFNQAVAAARQGACVSFLGACADEDVSKISGFCLGEGIVPQMMGKAGSTAYAVILTDPTGQTHVTVCPGVELSVTDVDAFEKSIAESDVLLLNNEVPADVNERAAELAARYGTRIVCNPAPARQLTPSVAEFTEVFTPNEAEAVALGEVKGEIVVTLGGDGCLIRSTGEVVPAVSFGPVVDTTGAGDTFSGVLAARLACGDKLREAVAMANIAAGKSVTIRHVMPSIPRAG